LADFTIGNSSLGGSTGYTAVDSGYYEAKEQIHEMLQNGQRPEIYGRSVEDIERVAGSFSYEDREELKKYGY
jgi:hypothetical protein